MQDRAPTKAGRVLITPEDGSTPFYATMTRADEPTQIGDPLNKKTFLPDAVAAMFGLDATALPSDVLEYLGKYAQHWWSRRTYKAAYTTEASFTSKRIGWAAKSSAYVSFSYGTEITVDERGEIKLAGENGGTNAQYTSTSYIKDYIAGKYFYVEASDGSTTTASPIYFCDASATITTSDDSSKTYRYGIIISAGKTVTGHKETIGETAEYVRAQSENAYPHYGISGGYFYQYIGSPLDTAALYSPFRKLKDIVINTAAAQIDVDVTDIDLEAYAYLLIVPRLWGVSDSIASIRLRVNGLADDYDNVTSSTDDCICYFDANSAYKSSADTSTLIRLSGHGTERIHAKVEQSTEYTGDNSGSIAVAPSELETLNFATSDGSKLLPPGRITIYGVMF